MYLEAGILPFYSLDFDRHWLFREANPKKSKIMQEKYAPILSRSTFT